MTLVRAIADHTMTLDDLIQRLTRVRDSHQGKPMPIAVMHAWPTGPGMHFVPCVNVIDEGDFVSIVPDFGYAQHTMSGAIGYPQKFRGVIPPREEDGTV